MSARPRSRWARRSPCAPRVPSVVTIGIALTSISCSPSSERLDPEAVVGRPPAPQGHGERQLARGRAARRPCSMGPKARAPLLRAHPAGLLEAPCRAARRRPRCRRRPRRPRPPGTPAWTGPPSGCERGSAPGAAGLRSPRLTLRPRRAPAGVVCASHNGVVAHVVEHAAAADLHAPVADRPGDGCASRGPGGSRARGRAARRAGRRPSRWPRPRRCRSPPGTPAPGPRRPPRRRRPTRRPRRRRPPGAASASTSAGESSRRNS